MKVLFIYDDIWHPVDVIERGLKTFGPRLNDYAFDKVITAKDILTKDYVKDFPVILNAKGAAINAANCSPWFEEGVTEFMPNDLREYIENGGGYVSLHAANTFMTTNCPDMVNLVGCSYVSHPPRCMTHVYPTKDHPITKGVEAFDERDEHYILDYNQPDMDVFMHTSSELGGDRISGYTLERGKGRIVVLTMCHTLDFWSNKNFQTLLMNAIDWAGKKI